MNVKSDVVGIRNDMGDDVDEARSGKDLGYAGLSDCLARRGEGVVLNVGVNKIGEKSVQILVNVRLGSSSSRSVLKMEQSLRRLGDRLFFFLLVINDVSQRGHQPQ